MLISCLTEPSSVASATAVLGPVVDPISRRSPADLPCQVQDPDLWFAETPGELELAKAFCTDCPARGGCLAGALRRRERWGVWGGEIFDRGRIVARKRPRGARATPTSPHEKTTQDHQLRSIEMFTLHAELARERILDARRVAEQYRVSHRLASARRWRWLERTAHSAHKRRARAAAESAAALAHRWAS